MRIRFTPPARWQFLEGLAYVRRDSPPAAGRLRERVEKTLRRLEAHPESGRVIPAFPDLPHREAIVRQYRFFYRVEKETIWIVAARPGAQRTNKPV